MNLRWGMHCHQARGVVTSVCSRSTTEVVSLVRLWSRAISDLTSAISYVRTFDNFCCPVGDNYLYVFKGALRAPGRGWQPRLNRRRATQALAPMRRSSPQPAGRRSPGKRFARRAPRAALRPCGPRRRRRALRPRTGRSWRAAARASTRRARQELPSSRRSSIEPGKITIKSALRASLRDGASATLDADLPRLVRRLSGAWSGLEATAAPGLAGVGRGPSALDSDV